VVLVTAMKQDDEKISHWDKFNRALEQWMLLAYNYERAHAKFADRRQLKALAKDLSRARQIWWDAGEALRRSGAPAPAPFASKIQALAERSLAEACSKCGEPWDLVSDQEVGCSQCGVRKAVKDLF
jgi:hypothetical protein